VRDSPARRVAAIQVTVPAQRWNDDVFEHCLSVLTSSAG
jgi:hypothetical protein